MEDRSFKTICNKSSGLYKEKGSKFISFAFPVNDLEDVKSNLEDIKKEYHDARHHCYAYIIEDANNQLIRANDDGEPNHSAGDPILGQIKSLELTNTLVIVVRYFGGTKLGVSGLINAYRTAAEEALVLNSIRTVIIKSSITVHYDYERTSDAMRVMKMFDVTIKNQEYNERCVILGEILPSQEIALKAKIELIDGVDLL